MGSGYSNTVTVDVTCGTPQLVGLPMPPRGQLNRLIMTQTAGNAEEATCNLYDRRGACTRGTDLNVKFSGTYNSVTGGGENDTYAVIWFDNPHDLIPGDKIVLKTLSGNQSYNGLILTVTEVLTSLKVLVDTPYIDDDYGIWQSAPWMPTTAPVTHLVYSFSKEAGTDYIEFNLNLEYENKDNQSETMRCRASYLWLDILTVGSPEQVTYQIAYTVKSDTVV